MMKIKVAVLLIANILFLAQVGQAQDSGGTTTTTTETTEVPPPEIGELSPIEGAPVVPAASGTPQSKTKRVANKFKKNQQKSQPADFDAESSSYVPNPDPLDPLPVNSENLKDEDAIVVDDIKEVLDKPLPPPVLEPAPPPPVEASAPTTPEDIHPSKIDEFSDENSSGQLDSSDDSDSNGIIKKPRKPKRAARPEKVYNDNDPDLELEKRFHQLYSRLNSQPTSAQAWEAVTAPRTAQVYIIQKGDNLYNISGTLFGDSQFWPKIWSLNEMDIMNPHFIYPNQRIYFYPGTIDMAPTLGLEKTPNTILPNEAPPVLPLPPTLEAPPLAEDKKEKPREEKMDANSAELIQEANDEDAIDRSRRPVLSEEKAIDGRTYDRQNTEWRKNIIVKSKKELVEEVEVVPNSLPEYFSGKYFEPRKADFTLDIKRPEVKPIEIPPNPYIITNTIIQTDFKIPGEIADSIQCKDNHYVQRVDKVNLQAESGRYFLLEQLKLTSKTFKTTQLYRWIATADVTSITTVNASGEKVNNGSLRILKCRQLINSDVLVVSQEKLNQLQAPVEVGAKDLEIIEGLDYVNQVFVGANQFVLLSAGTDLMQADQTYSIYSKAAGATVGKIAVVKKQGPLAVGYVIEASDVIHLNDTLVVE